MSKRTAPFAPGSAPAPIPAPLPARGQDSRRVGRQHLAFIKGYFEGIDIATLAEQYLDMGRDRRKARVERRWILDELITAARQRGDVSAVRLLKLPAGALPETTPDDAPQPLERFRERIDPEGVYSETELVALYQETCAEAVPSRQRARNARLRRRQRLLLDTLEASLVEPPRLGHHVGDWFDAALAARLEAVQLDTIDKLVRHINRYGYRWYERVPRVGEQTARRVRDWLRRHESDLALSIAPASELPRSAWSPAQRDAHRRAALVIAPIESFDPPHAAARADRDALLRVLARHVERPATYRAYRLQAERLLLWMSLVRETSLPRLGAEDAAMFLHFVLAPTPAQRWCGPKAERGTAQWRPFERATPATGLALVRRILSSLCAALMKDGYLAANPFQHPAVPLATVAGGVSLAPRAPVPRSAPPLLDALCALPARDLSSLRMRVVFLLLRDTGLPLHALTRLRVASLANWPRLAPIPRRVAQYGKTPVASGAGPAGPVPTGPVGPAGSTGDIDTNTGISISCDTMTALEDYFRARGVDPAHPRNRDMRLIGRHIAPGIAGDAPDHAPVTPNVLGRAITAFLAARATRFVAPSSSPAGKPTALLPAVSFRSLCRQARQRARERMPDAKRAPGRARRAAS